MPKEISKHHLLPLDGLRGLAVLTVFAYHYGGGTNSGVRVLRVVAVINLAGWSGVTLFFILSGFLITGILWDTRGEPHWWRNFYARRALRIFPLYYAALVLVLIAAAWAGTLHQALAKIWSPMLFLQDIPGPDRSTLATGSPLRLYHFWSLAVEEQFYLLWPLLLLLQRDRRQAMRLCAWVFVASAMFRIGVCLLEPNVDRWVPFLLARAGELAAGGWVALAYRDALWSKLQRPARWLAVVGFVIFATVCVLVGSSKLEGRAQFAVGLPAVTILYASLLVLSLQGGVVSRLTSLAWLRWFGSISYGMYVFHILLTAAFSEIALDLARGQTGNLYLSLRFVVALAGSVLMAWISFNLFERPILRLKRYFAAGARGSRS